MQKRKKVKTQKAPALFLQERRDLIHKLVSKDYPINWVLELSITKRLFKLYPNPNFWNQFALPPGFQDVKSLTLLCGAWGRDYIRKSFNLWQYTNAAPKTQLKLLDEKLGEDMKIKKEPTRSEERRVGKES